MSHGNSSEDNSLRVLYSYFSQSFGDKPCISVNGMPQTILANSVCNIFILIHGFSSNICRSAIAPYYSNYNCSHIHTVELLNISASLQCSLAIAITLVCCTYYCLSITQTQWSVAWFGGKCLPVCACIRTLSLTLVQQFMCRSIIGMGVGQFQSKTFRCAPNAFRRLRNAQDR